MAEMAVNETPAREMDVNMEHHEMEVEAHRQELGVQTEREAR